MSILKKFQNYIKDTSAKRKYYALVVWNTRDKTWEVEFGDYDKKTVIQERKDYHDSGSNYDVLKKNTKVVEVDGDMQADIEAMIKKLNAETKGKGK